MGPTKLMYNLKMRVDREMKKGEKLAEEKAIEAK